MERRFKILKLMFLFVGLFLVLRTQAQTLSAGQSRVFYICDDSTLSATGFNNLGQLGDGTAINRHYPVKVKGLKSVTNVDAIGYWALKSDGTVWQWWKNNSYGLNKISVEDVVAISSTVVPSSSFEYSVWSYFAVKSDGTVWAWGDALESDYWGYSDSIRKIEVQNVKTVKAGGTCVIALCKDSTVWTWGSTWIRGNGEMIDQFKPKNDYNPIKVNSLNKIVDIAKGPEYCVALDTEGKVWVWGEVQSTPRIFLPSPVQLQVSGIKSIYCNGWMFAAINNAGEMFVHDFGLVFNPIPRKVEFVDNVTELASSGHDNSVSYHFRKSDGTFWRWGRNLGGQLGNFTEFPITAPEQMLHPCMAVDCDTITKKPDFLKLDTFVKPGVPVKLSCSQSEADLYWWYPQSNILSGNSNREAVVRINEYDVEFSAVMMDTYGCMRKERFKLRRKCEDKIQTKLDTVSYPGAKMELTAGEGYSYVWDYSPELNCTRCQTTLASVQDSNSYNVTYFDTYHCPAKEKFIVRIRNCDTIIKNYDKLMVDTLITPGEYIRLLASNAISYKWKPSTGISCDTCQDTQVRIYDNTEYVVTLTDKFRCQWKERFKLSNTCDSSSIINPKLVLDTITYPSAKIKLNASEAKTYQWNPNSGLDCISCQHPNVTVSVPITFISTLTDSFNCIRKEKFNLRIRNCDTIQLNQVLRLDTTIHYPTEIKLNASYSHNGYKWDNINGMNCADCQAPSIFVNQSSLFIVTVWDNWLCPFNEVFKITMVNLDVIIPNVFTPNGDGVNDYFEIKGLKPGSILKIYDSIGDLIYLSTNYQNDWDGNKNDGSFSNEGTYWYLLSVPQSGSYKGWIYLKR